MENIILYIYKKYGYQLNINEVNIVIDWYNKDKDILINEEILDESLTKFLYKAFPNKILHINDEDTSNMNYLLILLKDTSRKNKNK
ncbi:hypothetical protein [Clostridium algidicarnis]|uniref:hypothetical protein n=1 Tax=Clostridium algidicarnis TaxID=37659 RepID=UPI001625A4BD|nr:hypothetical protein [Clostridium algidicarnis]MBB6698243.1 hypothetical protein [Clostridium algidicarnis]